MTDPIEAIKRIEDGEKIDREEFRSLELLGLLSPHVFVENPTNALCKDCSLRIDFS